MGIFKVFLCILALFYDTIRRSVGAARIKCCSVSCKRNSQPLECEAGRENKRRGGVIGCDEKCASLTLSLLRDCRYYGPSVCLCGGMCTTELSQVPLAADSSSVYIRSLAKKQGLGDSD